MVYWDGFEKCEEGALELVGLSKHERTLLSITHKAESHILNNMLRVAAEKLDGFKLLLGDCFESSPVECLAPVGAPARREVDTTVEALEVPPTSCQRHSIDVAVQTAPLKPDTKIVKQVIALVADNRRLLQELARLRFAIAKVPTSPPSPPTAPAAATVVPQKSPVANSDVGTKFLAPAAAMHAGDQTSASIASDQSPEVSNLKRLVRDGHDDATPHPH